MPKTPPVCTHREMLEVRHELIVRGLTLVVVPSSTPSRSICTEKLFPRTRILSLGLSCLYREVNAREVGVCVRVSHLVLL